MRASLILGLAACASSPASAPMTPTPAAPTPAPSTVAERYAAAVADARDASAAEVVRELRVIAPTTPGLQWQDGKVLVATWTGWPGYDTLVGTSLPSAREVWVTAVPDVQAFCKTIAPTALTARLEQRLGLPPENGKTRFVELWVAPGDLFRPCPDAEVTDDHCDLDIQTLAVPATAEHRAWFDKLAGGSYGDKGYPWTRLGYTYDWGTTTTHVGPSEFVVRAGAAITVAKVSPTAAYCAP